jgi:cyclopropane-fatty-acyl-phospholipid synthase
MISKTIFDRVLRGLTEGALEVDYWGVERKTYGRGKPTVTMVLKDPKVVGELVRKSDLGFGEAYMDGRIEFSKGSLAELLKITNRNQVVIDSSLGKLKAYRYNKNVRRAQKKQIQSHYDLGNDFYALWLDDTMTYTCAYFRSPSDTLETAQRQKIDHVLRKLQLQKGHEFVDLGCGWGHLVIRAAKLYGAKGLGVTLSREQYQYAKELAKKEGVADLATFKNINYLDLVPTKKQYDRVVSVGILEHVGRGNHRQYFKTVDSLLKPGGVSVLHSITNQIESGVSPWIDKYIFPGGYIPSIREIITLMPEFRFRLLDLENLRPHYALTLDEWLRRFEKHVPEITKMYDERFIRMWRLYLEGSKSSFRYGVNDLSQLVFTKGINNDLPLTREHLYTS